MTAENVITLRPPRNPLLAEMMAAFETALTLPADTLPRRFHEGLGLGYAVAFNLTTREALDRARRQPGSANIHLDFRRPRFDDDPDTLWACGVRHGYALATSEHTDADECALCGERLTDADDSEQCFDGRFCANGECSHDWHANGPALCGDEPE